MSIMNTMSIMSITSTIRITNNISIMSMIGIASITSNSCKFGSKAAVKGVALGLPQGLCRCFGLFKRALMRAFPCVSVGVSVKGVAFGLPKLF